jgi:hypothetical protein
LRTSLKQKLVLLVPLTFLLGNGKVRKCGREKTL